MENLKTKVIELFEAVYGYAPARKDVSAFVSEDGKTIYCIIEHEQYRIVDEKHIYKV